MLGSRGMVVLGAVVLAGLAFFVLMRDGGVRDIGDVGGGGGVRGVRGVGGDVRNGTPAPRGGQAVKPTGPISRELPPRNAPALDDIDAESRAKMRELLREAGEE